MKHKGKAARMARLLAMWLAMVPASVASDKTAPPADIEKLRQQIAEQRKQIEALQKALAEQQRQLDEMTSAVAEQAAPQRETPVAKATAPAETKPGPLQLKIGEALLTPVGFMDLIGVYRSTNTGNGLGTAFGSIPVDTPANAAAHLSEHRLSAQNSRLGFRLDTTYKGYNVLGYFEADFLGNAPNGLAITSNGNTPRMRLFFADVRKDKWEIAAGQTWSMLTPGRKGVAILPGDVFTSQMVDTNYPVGLTWSRGPALRAVLHANRTVSVAVAVEQSEQYMGGASGGSKIVLPAALAGLAGTQLQDGSLNGLQTPAVMPDVVGKAAFDGTFTNGHAWHVELGAVVREFKIYDTQAASRRSFSTTGGAGQLNFNVEVARGLRLVSNNYYGSGGGRYLMGQAPDVMVRADGSLHTIASGSTLDGFEYTRGNTLFYGYYGNVYVDRRQALDTDGKTAIGYGYTNASGFGQNRSIQETSFGFNRTLWRDARYGALNFAVQYAYVSRRPWFYSGTPSDAHVHMVYYNFRYTLPGAAPTLGAPPGK